MSFTNLSIAKRLSLVVVLPLLLIVFLASQQVKTMYQNYTQMSAVSDIGARISSLSGAIHFLQIERGQTVGYLSSKGANGGDDLRITRAASDAHLIEVDKIIGMFVQQTDELGHMSQQLLSSLRELDVLRREIDALKVTGGQSFDAYTKVLGQLIGFSVELSMEGMASRVADEIMAFNQVMQAKEIAGQERGLGNGFLAASKIAIERLAQFAAFSGAQESLLNVFLKLQSDDLRDKYSKMIEIPQESYIADVRNAVITNGVYTDLRELEAAKWFAATTKRIENMRQIELESVERIRIAASDDSRLALDGLKTVVGLLSIGALLMIVFSVRIALSISRPIKHLVKAMAAITNGDLRESEIGAGRRDEIGEMARAVNVLRLASLRNRQLEQEAEDNRHTSQEQMRLAQERADAEAQRRMDEATSALARALRSLAAGDLLCEINEPLDAQFEGLRRDFNGSVRQLREALQSVGASVATVHSGAFEISQASDDLSRRTEQQASSLEETAAALEQITVNVKATSRRSDEARDVTRDAHHQAGVSGQIVENAVCAMQRIDNASRQIGQIIGVIDEIAFQTNLLALNAGVEAARAGDAGKGFAVVAQEVRDLAQRSANAAREIKVLITNSETAVAEGVKLVSDTGKGLSDISGLVDRVHEHMNAIATAAQEQAAGLSEVNAAINHMDQSTQKNAAMVEEMNAAGVGLASESETLDRLLTSFKLDAGDMRRAAS